MHASVWRSERTPSGVTMHLVKHLCTYFCVGACVCMYVHFMACVWRQRTTCRNWTRFSPSIMWLELRSLNLVAGVPPTFSDRVSHCSGTSPSLGWLASKFSASTSFYLPSRRHWNYRPVLTHADSRVLGIQTQGLMFWRRTFF